MKMKLFDLATWELAQWAKPADYIKTEITELSKNKFHIEKDKNNPFYGYSYDLEIIKTDNEYEFIITNSAYGDDIIDVYDHNLKFLYNRDVVTREIHIVPEI